MSDPAPADDAASKVKTPKVVVALLLMNTLVSGFVLAMVMTKGAAPHGTAAAHAKPEASGESSDRITGRVVELDPFVINLNEPGSSRYLKVQLQLELKDGAAEKVFQKSKQLVREDILGFLSGLKVADALGPENKNKIREALTLAANDRLGEDTVIRVIITDFVVQ